MQDLHADLLQRAAEARSAQARDYWLEHAERIDRHLSPGALKFKWCRFVSSREITLADHRLALQAA